MVSLKKYLTDIEACIEAPRKGLSEEVVLFVSKITPLVNGYLLVRDDAGRILLSWRDDPYVGRSWYVLGDN